MEKMNNPYESLDLNTRIALAEDINTPIETLEILATDKNHYVLEAVSGNPSTPEKILTRLIEDYNIRTFLRLLKIQVFLPNSLLVSVRVNIGMFANLSLNTQMFL